MICKNCGAKLPDDSVFCESCGVRLTIDENNAADKNSFSQQPKPKAEASSAKAASPVTDEKDLLEAKYNEAVKILNEAQKPNDYAAAGKIFTSLNGYKDSKQKETECKEKFFEIIYTQAVDIYKSADNEDSLNKAKSYFQQLGDYKDSKELLSECQKKLKDIDNEKRYAEAVKLLNIYTDEVNITRAVNILKGLDPYKESTRLLEEATADLNELKYKALTNRKNNRDPKTNMTQLAEDFKKLRNYKDSKELAAECEEIVKEERRKEENKRKNRKRMLIFSGIACVVIIAAIIIYIPVKKVIDRKNKYETAVACYENGDYASAVGLFMELGDYKDSAYRLKESYEGCYQSEMTTAKEFYNSGDYLSALSWFKTAQSSKETAEVYEWIEECTSLVYQYALDQYNAGNYEDAKMYFNNITSYKDASDMVENCKNGIIYDSAIESYNAEDYDEALEQFKTIKGFKDTDSYIDSIDTMGMIEDCKEAYIDYLSEPRSYGGYTAEDLGYILYDFDNNGIPELITNEYAGPEGNIPDNILTVLTYNGTVNKLYRELINLSPLINDSGKIYFREPNYSIDGKFKIYKGNLTNGTFSMSIAYSNVYDAGAKDYFLEWDYYTESEVSNMTFISDLGLYSYKYYDGSDFSAIYNY